MGLEGFLVIAVGVLLMAIIILGLVYWKISIDEKNKDLTQIKQKNSQKENIKNSNKNTTQYNKQSIFSFMEFDKIEDNMIIQKNGERFLMVVECQGINYDLMSGIEKTSVEEGFNQFLNTLRHPIQIYTQTRTINLESSLQNYKKRLEDIKLDLERKENKYKQMLQSDTYDKNEINKQNLEITKERNLYEYGKDVIYNTERMSLNKNVLRKQYYIIIPYYSAEIGNELFDKDEIRNIAFSELYTKAQSIIRTLSACSISGRVMDSYDLVDLLYNAYNRDEAEVYGLDKALRAGYDELYSTAPDVLDKKMEALNNEIEERALEKAKEVVDEAISDKQKKIMQKQKNMDELIDDMAMLIINENEQYIGNDIAKEAKQKISNSKKTKDKGGNDNEQKEKTRTRKRTSKSA